MIKGKRVLSVAVSSALCFAALPLAGCNHAATPVVPAVAAASVTDSAIPAPVAASASLPQAASAPDAYTLPSANQLYELVAPIALFPDKLLAQVLAGSTYPDQIDAADQWLAQNPTLKGRALQSAVDGQPWDASVKSLTGFRSVLDQLAQNTAWTAALGEAYVNDPIDVMNAVQVMRQRASAKGALKNNVQQHVSTVVQSAVTPADQQLSEVQAGQPGSVIVPPPQTIVIEPAQPNVVYVPMYNPTVVYGMPMPLYPGYVYAPPAYSEADMVVTGLVSFGLGVAVGAALDNHYNWGWNAWGVHWNSGYAGGWVAHGGGVVFRNAPYVSHSTTIVNRVNNIHVGPNYRDGHDVDRHLIDTGPSHRLDQPGRRDAPDFKHMSQPHFTDYNHADQRNLDPTAHRNQAAPARRAEPEAPLHQHENGAAGLARPADRPAYQPDARQHTASSANRQAYGPGPAYHQGNPATLYPQRHAPVAPERGGTRQPQLGHAPLEATARTAPLTNRDTEGGLLGSSARWHRR